MAQLKNTIVLGSLRATDTLYATTSQFLILNIPTASNGTTYGPGTSGQVLKSNGTSVYWANESNPTSFTITANATDGIWDITGTNGSNAVTYAIAPYSSQLSKLSFDTSSTAPTRTDRLNYNGYFYATRLNNLTLTAAATGFTIAGGTTTSKTLTVSETYTLGAACAKGVTDNSSNTDVTSSDTNLITGRTLYYQLAKKGYTTNTGTVTSITLKAGTGISLDVDNTAITTSGTRTISHATGDGNLHVPANGTGNNGKFLQATATAGSYLWASLPAASTTTAGITTVGVSGGAAAYSHGNHVPTTETANNARFLRNDNTWLTVTPANIGAVAKSGDTMTGRLTAAKGLVNLLTGSGTAGVNNSGTYTPVKWTFDAGVTAADGDRFTVKVPNITNGDYGVFMSVNNGTNYYPIATNGTSRLTTHYPVNSYVEVVFEASGSVASVFPVAGGTSRVTVSNGCWRIINYYDSNSDYGYYTRMIYPNIKAGTGSIHPYSIIMQLANGRWSSITATAPNNPGASNVSPKATGKSANTNAFRLSPIYYMSANTTYSDGSNVGTYNVYESHTGLIDARYSFNLENSSTNGFTGYLPVYIVGTLDGGLFKLDTTKWWTLTLPSAEDNKIYIHIGDAYDWYRLTLQVIKPIYWYKNGAIQSYSGASTYAAAAPLSGVSGADDLKAIEALTGTSGLLKKTAANTWSLDTSSYVTSSGVTSITLTQGDGITVSNSGTAITSTGSRTISLGVNIRNGTGTGAIIESTITGDFANIASGNYAHAEGQNTTASAAGAHAEGYGTEASDYDAHAEGGYTTASGPYSHAEGYYTTASGYYSHAENSHATASGSESHAEGYDTIASGDYSHAEGFVTIANHASLHVFGEYNIGDTSTAAATERGTYIEIVGNGASRDSRANARTLDWSGNEWLAGGLTLNNNLMVYGQIMGDIPLDIDTVTLWTNSSTTSDFTAQTLSGTNVNLIGKNIIYIIIDCWTNKSSGSAAGGVILNYNSSSSTQIGFYNSERFGFTTGTYTYSRVLSGTDTLGKFIITKSTGAWSIAFGTGYRGSTSGNGYCMPYKIKACYVNFPTLTPREV